VGPSVHVSDVGLNTHCAWTNFPHNTPTAPPPVDSFTHPPPTLPHAHPSTAQLYVTRCVVNLPVFARLVHGSALYLTRLQSQLPCLLATGRDLLPLPYSSCANV
jgi:hypothetical protein